MGVCMTVYFFSLSPQRDEARRQCRDLSQELVNLQGELGKSGQVDYAPALFKVVIRKVHTPGTGSPSSAAFLMCLRPDDYSVYMTIEEALWIT